MEPTITLTIRQYTRILIDPQLRERLLRAHINAQLKVIGEYLQECDDATETTSMPEPPA